MKRARVVTRWIGTGTQTDPNRPAVADNFPLLRWQDITGTDAAKLRSGGDLVTIDIECDDAVLPTIKADVNHLVIDDDDVPENTVVTTAVFNGLRTRLQSLGMPTALLNRVVGTSAGGRTRREIKQDLIRWLKDRD